MRIRFEAFGRRLKVDVVKTRPRPSEAPLWEPSPHGSTCGDLERARSWDHDHREPVGFARNREDI